MSILLIIIGYAFLMALVKVTKFKPKAGWSKSLLSFFTIGVPVAVVEEVIFRYGFFDRLLIQKFQLSIPLAMIYASMFFASAHFSLYWLNAIIKAIFKKDLGVGGMHKNAFYKIELFIGLTLFAMIASKLYFAMPLFAIGSWKFGQNILFHASAIYGVQLTSVLFTKESKDNWWIWDEGHQLLRSPVMWVVLVSYYLAI